MGAENDLEAQVDAAQLENDDVEETESGCCCTIMSILCGALVLAILGGVTFFCLPRKRYVCPVCGINVDKISFLSLPICKSKPACQLGLEGGAKCVVYASTEHWKCSNDSCGHFGIYNDVGSSKHIQISRGEREYRKHRGLNGQPLDAECRHCGSDVKHPQTTVSG